jgi:myo-inositol-1(or 4)-monophosphatase
MITSTEVSRLLDVAKEAAVAGGKLGRERFHQPLQISKKGLRDLVTDADVAAQQVITGLIHERFPEHGFLVEEESDLPAERPLIWVVDPIDGTTNYSRNQPIFCVSVAAVSLVDGKPLAGAIYDPMQDELFSAAAGQGAWLNGRRLRVSPVATLAEAVVGLDWSRNHRTRRSTAEVVTYLADHAFTLRAIGSAALAMAWVAAGRLDAYLNYNLYAWDFAAAQLLAEEAGGELTGLGGEKLNCLTREPSSCLLSNALIHRELQTLIQTPSQPL